MENSTELNLLDDLDAVMIAEGNFDVSEKALIAAWQHLINTGLAWKLQGWFGRNAQALIDFEVCHPPLKGRDQLN